MTTQYIEHITKEGDRWDLIANEYYGDPTKYEPIIQANKYVPIIPTLPAGITLMIPIIEDTQTEDTTLLPPWRQ
jgi:nucleoid-associated protein YgaU